MKAKNEMRISFPSNSNNEAFGRAVVAAFAAQLDPTIDELSDIKTAVSEAVTNCIVHAYRDTIGMIYITAKYMTMEPCRSKSATRGAALQMWNRLCSRSLLRPGKNAQVWALL